MADRSKEAKRRLREAQAARAAARDALAEAEYEAGERRRLSPWSRTALVLVALLAVIGAGFTVWRAAVADAEFSDREMVAAARSGAELLLSADAQDERRAGRILSGATGEFYDTFVRSAEAYTRFTRQQGGRSTAQIEAAVLAVRDGAAGVVLLTATLRAEAPDGPAPRQLRLRVVVQPEDGRLKLAGVTFLP
ncbi:MAG: hypothetical protein QM809_07600 [Gordonia sp. (in: high G+C Gram-positive bacteria)]|uniref:hypothetical protein n=1 Tax=Gordonia sp. (in: high G+C Gram-positive bacteria) TaxID=84139 RepID=UPI0039E49CC7